MRRIFTLLFLLTAIVFRSQSVPTVLEQLKNLNSCWKQKQLADPVLNEKILLAGDISLIGMHLTLVEKELRSVSLTHLSAKQKANRKKCLDILHAYRLRSVYPQNIYHAQRTPYFIDHLGTACAVGHLIIETGHKDVATLISKNDNYGYMYDLAKKYPQILNWANEFGFTLDELAWIQPGYCWPAAPGTLVHVSCYGGADGYWTPDPSPDGYPAPYTYVGWYKWYNNTWIGAQGCFLSAGNYKCVVQDVTGAQHDYYQTITEPPMPPITVTNVSCYGGTNGAASVTPTSAGPHSYTWTPGYDSTQNPTNLAAGNYTVYIQNGSGCVSVVQTVITQPAALNASIASTDDNGSCDGSLSVTASGGVGPYTYQWNDPASQTTAVAGSLCQGTYMVTVTDSNGCITSSSGVVDISTSIKESVNERIRIVPNPASDYILVSSELDNVSVRMYNVVGEVVLESSCSKLKQNYISTSEISSGIYTVVFIQKERLIHFEKLVLTH